jgi:hypothetical protein
MHRDLVCSLEPGNYLFILLCAENAWQNIKSDDLCNWVENRIDGLIIIVVHY